MIGIGKITKIKDKSKLIIVFDSLAGGHDIVGYPIDPLRVPEVGDLVLFVVLPDGTGQSVMYQSLRDKDQSLVVDMKSGDNTVSVSNENVKIKNGQYTVTVDKSGVHITGLTIMKPISGLELAPNPASQIVSPNGPCSINSGVMLCPTNTQIDFS